MQKEIEANRASLELQQRLLTDFGVRAPSINVTRSPEQLPEQSWGGKLTRGLLIEIGVNITPDDERAAKFPTHIRGEAGNDIPVRYFQCNSTTVQTLG